MYRMQTLALTVFATFSMLPCLAADSFHDTLPPELQQLDQRMLDLNKRLEAEKPAALPKPTFKVRHPKIYKTAKKVRMVSHFMLPIIQCGGATAQMLMLFL